MLTNNNIVSDIKKFPTELHCVLTEIPEISFGSNWDKGGSAAAVFTPITKFLNEGTLGRNLQLLAGTNNIPLVETNEFSQKVMKETNRASLKLKFTIYTDTYNKRYNFTSSPYETWLRMLYFSTTPIFKASYTNLFNMIKTIASNISAHSGDLSKVYETITECAAVIGNNLPFVEKNKETQQNYAKLAQNIDDLTTMITEYLAESNRIGHVCWDVVIPQYLHETSKTSSPVLWNITDFNVQFSDKFTRGLVTKEDVVNNYRPRPLYANFNVTLTTNQVMTRDQYIGMLFGDKSKIVKMVEKKTS